MATGGKRPEYSETLGALIGEWEDSLGQQHRLQRDTIKRGLEAIRRREVDPDKLWLIITELLSAMHELAGHNEHDRHICDLMSDIVGPPNKTRPTLKEIEQRLATLTETASKD